MSIATHTQRRGFERFLAIISAFAVLTSLMVVFAPTALAHHPEISANQTCVDKQVRIAYESVSWKTDGTSGSGHSDIRIEVQVNGAGPWTEVANGAYTAADTYRFSGTFDASAYWEDSIVVRARAVGPWDNGVGGGETTATSAFTVTQDCFNPSCPSGYLEYKVDPVSAGLHGTYFTISNIQNGRSGPTFDWSSTMPVYQVIVKGGPGASIYDYPAGDSSDSGLHAPQNPNNGKWYGLSHVTFCYSEPEPETVDVTPNPQVCEVNNGVANGAVSFNIDPASGATVQVYSDAGHTNAVGAPLGDDEQLILTPGTYYWQAAATSGDYELNGPTSGQFTIDPCGVSAVVVDGACVVTQQGAAMGSVSVTIDPTSGATVQVSGPGGPYDFSGSGGSEELAPGTYTWVATSSSGFQLSGETDGEFTIDPCEAAVTVAAGNCVINSSGAPTGSVSVTIDPTSGATVQVSGPGGPYDFSGSGGSEELAPGTYTWVATSSSGFQLSGETDGEFTIDPCDASVVVASGQCEIADGPTGSVTVAIDVDSGAVVTVYDDELEVAAQFTGVGGSESLAPGTYTWEATPGDGFEFPKGEVTSGEFTIDPCVGVVTVAHGNCQVNTATAFGSVTAVIDPTAAATVSVLDSASKLVASFTGAGGTATLQAGAYTWTAEAADGFTLDVDAGSFTVVPCPEEVLGNVIEVDDPPAAAVQPPADEVEELVVLPFTGIDTSVLIMASVLLLGSGMYLLRTVTRRKEG